MKFPLLALMLALVSSLLPAAPLDRALEEAAVRQTVADYVGAYNAKDIVAMWKVVAPALESRNPYSGRTVLADVRFFQASFASPTLHQWRRTAQQVRFLRPDVAQVDGFGEDIVPPDNAGQPRPSIKLLFTYLLTKDNDQWRIASTRVWSPASPAPGQ